MPFFVCHNVESGRRWTVAVETTPIRIGRSREAEVGLREVGVSKEHAEIVRRGARWHVQDLGSRNGTLLNELRVTEGALREGDELAIGQTRIRFFLDPARAHEAAADLSRSARGAEYRSCAEETASEPLGLETATAGAETPSEGAANASVATEQDLSGSKRGPAVAGDDGGPLDPDAKSAPLEPAAVEPSAARAASPASSALPRSGSESDPSGTTALERTLHAVYEAPAERPEGAPSAPPTAGPPARPLRARKRARAEAASPLPPVSLSTWDFPHPRSRPRRVDLILAVSIGLAVGFALGFAAGFISGGSTAGEDEDIEGKVESAAMDRNLQSGSPDAPVVLVEALDDIGDETLAREGDPSGAGIDVVEPGPGRASSATVRGKDTRAELERLLGLPYPSDDPAATRRALIRLSLDLLGRPLLRSEMREIAALEPERRVDRILALREAGGGVPDVPRGSPGARAILESLLGDRISVELRESLASEEPGDVAELARRIGASKLYASELHTRKRRPNQRAASLWVDLLGSAPDGDNIEAVGRALEEASESTVVRTLLYSPKSRVTGPSSTASETTVAWLTDEYLRFASRLPENDEVERALAEIARDENGWRWVIQELATRADYRSY